MQEYTCRWAEKRKHRALMDGGRLAGLKRKKKTSLLGFFLACLSGRFPIFGGAGWLRHSNQQFPCAPGGHLV
jgi:hypothetical protein